MDDFFAGVLTRAIPWPAGQADLHWHILHDPLAVEEQLTGPYRKLTDQPGLAAVEARWVHTTVMRGGPVAQYRTAELRTILARVREEAASIAPFELTYGRPEVGRVALELPAYPGEPARRLWELTTRIHTEVTDARFPLRPPVYFPHASLAYGVAGEVRPDRLAMKALLSDLPNRPVTLPVTRISLIAQSHDGQHITWTHLGDAVLGGH